MDDATLQFYRDNARSYADWAKAPSARLVRFMGLLPAGGEVLELGCGAGNHSAVMLDAGFAVRSTDGSPEMAEVAARSLYQEAARRTLLQLGGANAALNRALETLLLHRDGEALDFIAEDFHARVIQHETDHLKGEVYLDRMPDLRSLAHLAEWQRYVLPEIHRQNSKETKD